MAKSKSMSKDKKIKIATIIVVAVLIIAGVASIIILQQQPDEKDKEPEEDEGVIDDRISPLAEQGCFVEIRRIRAKGIIEQMTDTGPLVERLNDMPLNDKGLGYPLLSKLTGRNINGLLLARVIKGRLPGRGWDQKPTFAYVVDIDGTEFKGNQYTTWNTGYIFNEIYDVVEDEQEKSEVQIKIVEPGDKVVECLDVTYDFRTGRWAGDDYFNDSDGYGHYNGTDYEIWFDVRQTDFDGDKIPYWTEVNVLGTNPMIDDRKLDPDKDNCSTAWEWMWGYDPFKWNNHRFLDPDNDGIQNVEEEYISKWLANPYHPEIYIEADYSAPAPDNRPLGFIPYKIEMKKGRFIPIKRPTIEKVMYTGQEVVFWEESQNMLMERFNQHGYTLHVDDGCMGEGGDELDFLAPEGVHPKYQVISEYYKKDFPDERKGIFRYMVLAIRGGGYNWNMDYTGHYDTICVSASDIFYRGTCNGIAITPRAQRVAQATSMLHEIGHSCGFNLTYCGGVDNSSAEGAVETWYSYKSVMNYFWYACRYFDYSDGSHGENDCNDWANIDLSSFQSAPNKYDLEGISLKITEPPYNR